MLVPDLVLDPALQVWVLVPIMVVMVLVGVIRHLATILLAPDNVVKDGSGNNKIMQQQNFLTYSSALRANAYNLPPHVFQATQSKLSEDLRGAKYVNEPDKKPNGLEMLTDPKAMETMTAGLKNQVMMFVPQTLMMSWINAFFGGFIVMKLPFPLTLRFKAMLQSGVATPDLDVRWVSSISWYILLLLGLRSVYALILGGSNQAGGAMGMAGSPQQAMMQPGTDFTKLHLAEAENLDLVKHKYLLDGIDERILKKYSKRK